MGTFDRRADLLFRGGTVFAGLADRRRCDALAVADGRVLAVGAERDLDALIGEGTRVVDIAGGMAMPGFQDAHVHPLWGGARLIGCGLDDAEDADDCIRIVDEFARAHPGHEWIVGGGWSMAHFPGGVPTAEALDRVVPDRPVYLMNCDGHGAWVNTRALELAGIDRGTPDPTDGRIERDADGEPTGAVHEGAMHLFERLLPHVTVDDDVEALLAGQRYLHSFGITGWQDAILGRYGGRSDASEAYLRCAQDGSLTARVVGALWWERDRGLEQLPEFIERRRTYQHGRFRATSVKIMQDGVAENFTASMLQPYLDGCGCQTGNRGIHFVDPGLLREAVVALDAEGFQVHVHAIGDGAVRAGLDAVEAAIRANGRSDLRHHLAHIQVVHPDDIPRFGRLGVVANMQALWAVAEAQMTELTIPFLGEPRASWQYPFGSLLRTGAPLAMGSDWSVSTPDPWAAMHVAVNRTPPPGDPQPASGPFLPDEAIDLGAALLAYTAGSAYVNHLDGETGSLAPGRLADIAVVDRDPFDGPPEEIGATRNRQTWVGGELVYGEAD